MKRKELFKKQYSLKIPFRKVLAFYKKLKKEGWEGLELYSKLKEFDESFTIHDFNKIKNL